MDGYWRGRQKSPCKKSSAYGFSSLRRSRRIHVLPAYLPSSTASPAACTETGRSGQNLPAAVRKISLRSLIPITDLIFVAGAQYTSICSGLSRSNDWLTGRRELAALHDAGIEVILDVVYNHTAEGNHLGPTLWPVINSVSKPPGDSSIPLNQNRVFRDLHHIAYVRALLNSEWCYPGISLQYRATERGFHAVLCNQCRLLVGDRIVRDARLGGIRSRRIVSRRIGSMRVLRT
jgi:hypothetical protein